MEIRVTPIYVVFSNWEEEIGIEKIFFSEDKAKDYLEEQKKIYPMLSWWINNYEVEE